MKLSLPKLFHEETRPYVIMTPSYTHISSGVRALHLLCHYLNEVGCRAFLVPSYNFGHQFKINPFLNTPGFTTDTHVAPILIYPDIVVGNPMVAKHIVRYFLAFPKHETVRDMREDEQVWGYTTSMAKSFQPGNVLTVPTFDKGIFYDNGATRKGFCFYAYKYNEISGNKLLPITDGMTKVEGTPRQVAEILRTHETCYVYEMSEVIVNAALCGCKVVLIKTDYFSSVAPDNEIMKFSGLVWSDGTLVNDGVGETALDMVKKLEDNFLPQLTHFVESSQLCFPL